MKTHAAKFEGTRTESVAMYCPHCDTKFYPRDMWRGLATRYRNADVIAEMTGLCRPYVWHFLAKYRLVKHLSVPTHMSRPDWKGIAKKFKYKTPQRLFWELRIRRGYSWEWVARFIGVEDNDELRLAARAYMSGEGKEELLEREGKL